jgi:HlyD family secretion protein
MKIIEWLKLKKPKSKRGMAVFTGIVIIAVVSVFVLINRDGNVSEMEEIVYSLTRGDIEIAITGNGTVFSSGSQELDPDGFEADVKAIYFNEGDKVKDGDLIYELESSSLVAEWTRAKIAYDNAALEYKTSNGDVSDLTVRAPVSGVIDSMDIDLGEIVEKGETIATVWDKSEVYIKTPINLAQKGKIKVGQSAEATFPSSFFVTEGKVARVENTPSSDGYGGLFQYVYVSVDNPGGFLEGVEAAIQIDTGNETISGITNGVLEYKEAEVLVSPGEAIVVKVLKQEKDYVNAGELIAVLESDSLTVQKMGMNVSLQEAKIELDELAEQLENLQVIAESDGILAGQDVSVGDTVGISSGSSSNTENESTLGSIKSFEKRMIIAVDELDINKVSMAQSAQITVDAAPGEVFEGEVVKISEIGDVQSGVATYDVTLSVPYSNLVKEGMSADGKILIESRTDVVLIPIEAVTEMKNRKMVTVYREGESGSEEKTVVPVETGIMDARYYEVLSGLEEGDRVVLTGLTTQTAETADKSVGIMPGMGTGKRPVGK